MILVDTSVWIDHFKRHDPTLVDLLVQGSVAIHRFVLGELAMGSLADRSAVLFTLSELPQVIAAEDAEVFALVQHHSLFGQGIGFIDAHLLASSRLTSNTQLWTRDKRLRAAAERLGLAYAVS